MEAPSVCSLCGGVGTYPPGDVDPCPGCNRGIELDEELALDARADLDEDAWALDADDDADEDWDGDPYDYGYDGGDDDL